MKKIGYILVVFFICSSTVFAGYLVKNASISHIRNTTNNTDSFTMLTSGGTGPCVGQSLTFKFEEASQPDILKRAYASALLAASTRKKVAVYNYIDDGCDGAVFIEIIF